MLNMELEYKYDEHEEGDMDTAHDVVDNRTGLWVATVLTIGMSKEIADQEDDAKAKSLAHIFAASLDMLADLREAAATLRRYEALHRAKNTEDSLAKAEVNAALATRFEATIAKATE